MTNRRIVKEWLMNEGLFENLPNLKDVVASKALKDFIEEKKSELAAFNFGSTTYKWQAKDIYETIKVMLHHAKRKINREAHNVVDEVEENAEDDGENDGANPIIDGQARSNVLGLCILFLGFYMFLVD
jgi:hypothetical protein